MEAYPQKSYQHGSQNTQGRKRSVLVQPAEKSERTKPEKNLMVPEIGIEPIRPLSSKRRILSPLCLPISPLGLGAESQALHLKPTL